MSINFINLSIRNEGKNTPREKAGRNFEHLSFSISEIILPSIMFRDLLSIYSSKSHIWLLNDFAWKPFRFWSNFVCIQIKLRASYKRLYQVLERERELQFVNFQVPESKYSSIQDARICLSFIKFSSNCVIIGNYQYFRSSFLL